MKGMKASYLGLELPKPCEADSLVRRDLSVAPFTMNDPFPKRYKVFLESPAKLVVPFHWGLSNIEGAPGAQECRSAGEDAPGMVFVGTLRPQQRDAADAVLRSWDACGGAMVCLPCGGGKTSVSLYLACELRKKTLVIVHTTVLKDQWKERIAQFIPKAKVSEVQGSVWDDSGDVVIAMLQTLSTRLPSERPFNPRQFGLVIADEAHRVAAPVLSRAMWGLCARRTLGLTATPTRKDGLGCVVEWFLGPIAFRVWREHEASTEVRPVKYDCPEFREPPPINRRGDICFATLLTRLCANEDRTERIADIVDSLARDRDVLVLSHRREHCRGLANALRAKGVDAQSYVGGDKHAPESKVIVSTYALTSEGFDMPRLTALVMATPASDVEQACGRVMRGASTGAVIVDIVDQWGPCFAQHSKRKALYSRSGFTVTHRGPSGEATTQQDPPHASPRAGAESFAFL
jgi:superfamily II DNA or RNA helicase